MPCLTKISVLCRNSLTLRLKTVESGEKKSEAPDPMVEMMQRIRSGNVALKKVAPVQEKSDSKGGIMAEMAKLLVSQY